MTTCTFSHIINHAKNQQKIRCNFNKKELNIAIQHQPISTAYRRTDNRRIIITPYRDDELIGFCSNVPKSPKDALFSS